MNLRGWMTPDPLWTPVLMTLLGRFMFNNYSGISGAMATVFLSGLYVACHSLLSVAVTERVCLNAPVTVYRSGKPKQELRQWELKLRPCGDAA